VGCFSPRHDLTLARMSVPISRWWWISGPRNTPNWAANPAIGHVQIFENRGEMMGASNPHPHCQIWASRSISTEVAAEEREQVAWRTGADRACCATIWR
jgi:UDPglucose--hexose-1-phosphate uridylyltransferase